jgi:hypothetical protein
LRSTRWCRSRSIILGYQLAPAGLGTIS